MRVYKNGKFIRGDTELQCYAVHGNSDNKYWTVDVLTFTGEIESIRCWYWQNKDKPWENQQMISVNRGPTWAKIRNAIHKFNSGE